MRRDREFYMVRVDGEDKILWRGMKLVHIKDLDEDQRKKVIDEVGRLRERGLGRDSIQKRIAEEHSVYVPEKVLEKLISGNREIDWDRCGPQGQRRDLRLRQKLYERVKRLRSEGKSYGEIKRTIEREFGIKLSAGHISYWCRDIYRPGRNVKKITMTADTWWLVGLLIADGTPNVRYDDNHRDYRLVLMVKDEELVLRASDVLQGQCYATRRNDGRIQLHISSRVLYETLFDVRRLIDEGRFTELTQIIGYEGSRMFIRGIFDGDGSGLFVHFVNNYVNLLEFIRYVLKMFDIETSPPVLMNKKGMTSYHELKNQWIITRKDVYNVFVFPDHYDRFFELIGSTLEKKPYHMKLSLRVLQKHSRLYGRSYLEEVRRRYANGESWVDVILPLMKGIGARMKRRK